MKVASSPDSRASLVRCPYDNLSPGIVIRAMEKTGARESGDEATWKRVLAQFMAPRIESTVLARDVVGLYNIEVHILHSDLFVLLNE